MSAFILFITADICIGPVDKASLTQHALMELVVQGITNKEMIYGYEVVPCEIVKWYGLTIKDHQVTWILWHRRRLHGSVHLEWLPFTVIRFVAFSNQLTGTIDLSHLPNVMEFLHLTANDFVGPIDLQRLPGELNDLHLAQTNLDGSVDLNRLPGKLQCLRLNRNQFSGCLNLTHLPPAMEILCLDNNLFSGTVDLTLLPSGLTELKLSGNRLSGEVFLDPALFDNVKVDAILTKRFLEIAPLDPNHVPRCWQTSLMDQFYASISKGRKINLAKGNASRDYCEWRGVTCNAGVVRMIMYTCEDCGNFDVHSLSPTVEKIQIDRSLQKYALQTREFPRELQTCSLSINRLFGSVDLRTLPANLRIMNLEENELTGPISLTSLPCKLEYLNLEGNRIVQPVVYYDRVPPKVKDIRLVKRAEGTNRIGKVCAVHAERAVKNKEIFKSIPQMKVQ